MEPEKLNEVYCTTTREPDLQGSGPRVFQILTIFYLFEGKVFYYYTCTSKCLQLQLAIMNLAIVNGKIVIGALSCLPPMLLANPYSG